MIEIIIIKPVVLQLYEALFFERKNFLCPYAYICINISNEKNMLTTTSMDINKIEKRENIRRQKDADLLNLKMESFDLKGMKMF